MTNTLHLLHVVKYITPSIYFMLHIILYSDASNIIVHNIMNNIW